MHHLLVFHLILEGLDLARVDGRKACDDGKKDGNSKKEATQTDKPGDRIAFSEVTLDPVLPQLEIFSPLKPRPVVSSFASDFSDFAFDNPHHDQDEEWESDKAEDESLLQSISSLESLPKEPESIDKSERRPRKRLILDSQSDEEEEEEQKADHRDRETPSDHFYDRDRERNMLIEALVQKKKTEKSERKEGKIKRQTKREQEQDDQTREKEEE